MPTLHPSRFAYVSIVSVSWSAAASIGPSVLAMISPAPPEQTLVLRDQGSMLSVLEEASGSHRMRGVVEPGRQGVQNYLELKIDQV